MYTSVCACVCVVFACERIYYQELRGPAFDETFACYFFKKAFEQDFLEDDANKGIVSYCIFEQTIADTKQFDESCNIAMLTFWQELLNAHVVSPLLSLFYISFCFSFEISNPHMSCL
jgi:hypothetical protein